MIPRGAVSEHGIKHGEEFTHGGDESHLTGLAGCDQLLIEGLDRRVVDSGAYGGHVECASDVGPSAPDGTSSPMSTTVPVQGSDTDKGGDLPAIEGAEFGECTDEGEGGNGADAGDISEEE